MKKTNRILSLLLVFCMLILLSSCGKSADTLKDVNIYVLTGPTGVGAVQLWSRSDAGETEIRYHFTAAAAPDEAAAKLSSGEADIAAVATNLAAQLYQKTNGGIRILAVNTLGVLSVLDNSGAAVSSLSDLRGRTIVTTGQGANPQYILEYLLEQNGVDVTKDVSVEYRADGNELTAVWASQPDAVIVAPSPVSTAILSKYEDSQKVLDLTEEWEKCSPDSALMMGCVIARSDFCDAHPDAVKAFLADYEAALQTAQSDPEGTGALCEQYGIVPKAAIAAKALPDCHLCFITGEEMQKKLTGYLQILYDADPASVGAVPDDGIWYKG